MTRLKMVGLVTTVLAVVALTGSLVAGLLSRDSEAPSPGFDTRVDGDRLRVEVLNGAGVPGLARLATRELRELNFDVVFYGNASGEHRDSSLVVDRTGRPDDAGKVASAIGIERVSSEPDTTLQLEATVILGRDWSPRQSRGSDRER